jgi:large subunit ribosomal protein L22
MEINVELHYAHIAPRKMRLAATMVKGMSAREAELVLNQLVKRSAGPLLKLLKSGIANAKNNFQLDESGLYVKDIRVNGGPMAKRMMPRAFGRGATIRKRTSHVILVLEAREGNAAPTKKVQRKKDQPVVRDAQADDLKSDTTDQEKGEGRSLEKKKVRRTGRFTPRVFQRKVI